MRVSEWELQTLVGDENRCQSEAFGGAETDLLYVSRRGVGVDPQSKGHCVDEDLNGLVTVTGVITYGSEP
jgi:hypothetical protein